MRTFKKEDIKKLYKPKNDSSGEDNGSVTIIGGSKLFHGAPILALKTASRIVDMVFFASPDPGVGEVAEKIKSKLQSFIWVPWEEVEHYIAKSDAALIGPGFMRFSRESQVVNHKPLTNGDKAARETREITKRLLSKFKEKKWVIDAGSLQTMDKSWIPKNSILTPNAKEIQILFGSEIQEGENGIEEIKRISQKYNCIIVAKGPETMVVSPGDETLVQGGNPGLTKGGSGDVLAGLTVSLLAKNDPFLAACAASFIEKAASDYLYSRFNTNYNMDDLADEIPKVYGNFMKE